LAADWRRTPHWASVVSYRGEIGHPFIFSREAFPDLRRLHGDKAVWKLIESFPERVRRVEVAAELPPDVDRPEDYARALAHWQRTVVANRRRRHRSGLTSGVEET
jgi:molybdenum cofactor cytidylyltransferase